MPHLLRFPLLDLKLQGYAGNRCLPQGSTGYGQLFEHRLSASETLTSSKLLRQAYAR